MNFGFQTNIFFVESIPLCAARVDSLKSHGHNEAALRLAVSVVRTMKQQQLVAQRKWHESQQNASSSSSKPDASCKTTACTSRCNGFCYANACSTTSANAPVNTEMWVGHPLDPIGCLFDTLADASVLPDDHTRSPSFLGNLQISIINV